MKSVLPGSDVRDCLVIIVLTYLHRERLRCCSCRSAEGSIPRSLRVLSRIPILEPWQLPQLCRSVDTGSSWKYVSPSGTFTHRAPIGTEPHSFYQLTLEAKNSFAQFVIRILTLLCCFCLLSAVSRRDVLPKRRSVLCLQTVPKHQNQDQSPSQSSCSSEQLTSDSFISDHQGELYYEEGLSCVSHCGQILYFSKYCLLFYFNSVFNTFYVPGT